MSTLVWCAVGFCLFAVVAGIALAAANALRGWRRLKALRKGGLQTITDLTGRVETLERRLTGLGSRIGELDESIGSLNLSLARAKVLLGALQEVQETFASVRAFVPTK